VLFLINFGMDSLLLFGTAVLCKRPVRFRRIFAGAGVSSLLYCLCVYLDIARGLPSYNLPACFVVFISGLVVAFRPASPGIFLRLAGIFLLCAAATGGLCAAVYYLSAASRAFGAPLARFSAATLVVSGAGAFLALRRAAAFFRKTAAAARSYCFVKVYFDGKTADFSALADTGHSLSDPLSKAPVIVAEYAAVSALFPPEFRRVFAGSGEGALGAALAQIGGETPGNRLLRSRFRLLPFRSVGRESGLLVGFRPDKTEIFTERGIARPDAVIGVCGFPLSRDGSCAGLLSPEILRQTQEVSL
jgi:stage II sporulation protein GA (sporulation sigma-E factor processing peptidase)